MPERGRGPLGPGDAGLQPGPPRGWGEWVLARPERLYPIPPGVPEERAVFAEPLAVVLRGLNKLKPWPEEVLVLGMGTIGLLAVRLLRALGYAGRLLAVAKYPHQAERAKAFGADGVYGSAKEALLARARRYRYLLFEGHRGGYEAVVEASGSGRGFREALALAREGGRCSSWERRGLRLWTSPLLV